jgi:Na+-transporting NADH:ubiquinone oxidoreductase subunit C
VLTVVCGVVLAVTKQLLAPAQKMQIELDRKKNILLTFMELKESDDPLKIYSSRVKEYVINFEGEKVEGNAGDINVEKQSKKPKKERLLPVYEISSINDSSKTEFYVIQTWGKGLWDVISSFVSVRSDGNTINGVVFNHKAETPGLGARIKDDPNVYKRYKGKTIFEGDQLVSVEMKKGEGKDYSDKPHEIDGMSGATLTGKGVNAMLLEYTECYQKFLLKRREMYKMAAH